MGEAKRRAVPRLRDWLATQVASNDPAARDAYAGFVDWTVRLLETTQRPEDAEQARMLRMTQAASLAIVEICNQEQGRGADSPTVASDMCRAMGIAFGYCLMSLDYRDEAPVRSFATPFAEEFKAGVKVAIDQCLEASAAEAADA